VRSLRLSGIIRAGRIQYDQSAWAASLAAALDQWGDGARVRVTYRRDFPRRSIPQNKYYHSVVVATLADHLGYEPGEMHEALKRQRLGEDARDVVDEDGNVIHLHATRSTTKLTTATMTDYIEWCRAFAASLGCYIPAPNEPLARELCEED
jgi:hypothetical protein